jgi:hypothetical protein
MVIPSIDLNDELKTKLLKRIPLSLINIPMHRKEKIVSK